MTRPRIAVVGVGHLGKEHARILAGLPDVELVGVADINAQQAETIGRRYGCPAFGHHRPLLRLADAAIVVVPTTHHYSIAGEFLRCGIPILVEKPLACELEQAEELVELARRQGVQLQVGHIERFNPAYEQLQQTSLCPKYIRSTRVGPFSGRSTDIGVVLDLMIHDIDAVLSLVKSSVRTVEALGVSVFGGQEDMADARLTFENGCIAQLTASRAHPRPERRMDLWGAEGYAGIDFAKRRLKLIQPSEYVRQFGLNVRYLNPASIAMLKDDIFNKYLEVADHDCDNGADQLTQELRDFVHCVRTGSRPRVTGEDGRDAIAVAGRIIQRIQQHSWEGSAAGPKGPNELPAPQGALFSTRADSAAA